MQTCELVNLADLATETDHVRSTITAYLQDLRRASGVDGFRIDAAKHMAPAGRRRDRRGPARGHGDRPGGDPGRRRADHPGAVHRQRPGVRVRVRQGPPGRARRVARASRCELGNAATCRPTTPSCSSTTTTPSATARRCSYADGADYALANVLMLAGAYGTPQVYSGYAFSDRDAGPPQDAGRSRPRRRLPGRTRPGRRPADGDWVCQHRWPADRGDGRLARRRRRRAGDGRVVARATRVALGRGDRGFVVVNAGDERAPHRRWRRACRTVDYCDVLTGPVVRGEDCPGAELGVRRRLGVSVTVPREQRPGLATSRAAAEPSERQAGPDRRVGRDQHRARRRRPQVDRRQQHLGARGQRDRRRRRGWRRPARRGW